METDTNTLLLELVGVILTDIPVISIIEVELVVKAFVAKVLCICFTICPLPEMVTAI
jgi:hypothetical protein